MTGRYRKLWPTSGLRSSSKEKRALIPATLPLGQDTSVSNLARALRALASVPSKVRDNWAYR
jgi:hypothetical protein